MFLESPSKGMVLMSLNTQINTVIPLHVISQFRVITRGWGSMFKRTQNVINARKVMLFSLPVTVLRLLINRRLRHHSTV